MAIPGQQGFEPAKTRHAELLGSRQAMALTNLARPAADAFCVWLSARTGKKYRLPSEAEWLRAASLASGGRTVSPTRMELLAWHAGNAKGTSHASATRKADLLGLHDLLDAARHGRSIANE